jgi:cytochrome P450 family 135
VASEGLERRAAVAVTERTRRQREPLDRASLPPGPRWPSVVQTLMFLAGGQWTQPRWHRRYGDVFSIDLATSGKTVVVTRPEHIREVFAGPATTFHAGEGNAVLRPVMGAHSVLLLDEQAHAAARKRVMSAFHGEAMRSYGEVVEQFTAAQVARWPVGKPFAVHPGMNDISLEVILRIVFGVTDERRLAEMRPLLQRLVRIGPVVFLGWIYPQLAGFGPWKAFYRLRDATDAVLYAEIAERRVAADLAGRTDVLSKLIAADPTQSDEELRDHLVTLLLAGHETTASTLAWAFHDLSRQPAVLARVQRAAD